MPLLQFLMIGVALSGSWVAVGISPQSDESGRVPVTVRVLDSQGRAKNVPGVVFLHHAVYSSEDEGVGPKLRLSYSIEGMEQQALVDQWDFFSAHFLVRDHRKTQLYFLRPKQFRLVTADQILIDRTVPGVASIKLEVVSGDVEELHEVVSIHRWTGGRCAYAVARKGIKDD